MEEIRIIDWNDLSLLGHGGNGVVLLVKGFQPKSVAKLITTTTRAGREKLAKEAASLKKLRNDYIVRYVGEAKIEGGGVYTEGILMEYCERGSLYELIHSPEIVYSIKTVIWWAEHMIKALEYLQTKNMVHRDIKPANVLVTQAFWLKLADFGEIKEIQKTCSTFTDVGTRRYMSPEQTRTTDVIKLNHKSDIYSMGLVLWELIERRKVFSKYGKEDLYSINPNATQLIDLESFDCTHEIRQVVERCTAFDMNKRPYARELKALLPKKETITLKMKPEEDEKETRLIRPIGFDGTKNRVYIEGSGYLTPPPIPTSSASQSVAAHSRKSPTTSNSGLKAVTSIPLKKETKFHGNSNPLDFASLRSELMEIVKESQPTSSVNSENGEEVKKRGRPPGSKNKTGSQVKKNSTGTTIAKKPSSASLFD